MIHAFVLPGVAGEFPLECAALPRRDEVVEFLDKTWLVWEVRWKVGDGASSRLHAVVTLREAVVEEIT